MVFQPLGAYGAAITTSSLAEKPLLGESPVKPNIMYTLDESGSMSADYLPDYISLGDDKSGINKWCRDPLARTANCSKTVSPSTMSGNPPYASSNFNKMYYDPAVRYSAGIRVGADGSTSNLPFQAGSGWTNVYVDGFAGYPGPNPGTVANGGAINLVTGYPDEIYCTKSNPIVPDETDTAKNSSDGSVCRYNGKPYPGAPAGYNYPNATYTNRVPVKGGPYYYTISSVKFCPAPNSVGWGANGPQCTTRWSPTNLYVSFGASDFDPTAFARVDIDTNNAQEMNNFATWYAFARTRMLAMKTAGGTAFSALDARTRVGFNTINTFATNSNFLNIRDFTAANKTAWFTKFYSVAPIGETPTIDAMWRVGEYFANRGAAAGLPGATDPLDAATGQCQLNYHLMSTDGYWFQSVVDRPGIGNQDLNAPDPLPGPIPKSVSGQPAITAGQPFPLPYREGSGSDTTSNTMADVAMFYWINDIRPDFENKVKDKDSIATWQHVTLYGLSIGAVGTFDSNSRDAVTGGTGLRRLRHSMAQARHQHTDCDRRSLARRGKQSREVSERPDRGRPRAEDGKSCQRARCAAVGNRQRRRYSGQRGAAHCGLPDLLRADRLVGRRSKIRPRRQHGCGAGGCRRQPHPIAGVVRKVATGWTGRRHRVEYESAHRNHE
jgi:type IV pilus assembly protein PilY1